MSVTIDGFDDRAEEIRRLIAREETVDGSKTIPMDELFTPRFVATHTDHRTLGDFFAASRWEVRDASDIARIPSGDLDEFVRAETEFKSWDAMLRAAGRHWLVTHLE